jgi:hypothetical protein
MSMSPRAWMVGRLHQSLRAGAEASPPLRVAVEFTQIYLAVAAIAVWGSDPSNPGVLVLLLATYTCAVVAHAVWGSL